MLTTVRISIVGLALYAIFGWNAALYVGLGALIFNWLAIERLRVVMTRRRREQAEKMQEAFNDLKAYVEAKAQEQQSK